MRSVSDNKFNKPYITKLKILMNKPRSTNKPDLRAVCFCHRHWKTKCYFYEQNEQFKCRKSLPMFCRITKYDKLRLLEMLEMLHLY